MLSSYASFTGKNTNKDSLHKRSVKCGQRKDRQSQLADHNSATELDVDVKN